MYIMVATCCLGCSGPQPLSVAIDPATESAYFDALNSVKKDARQAFANWMAKERKGSAEKILEADAGLSTTKNPFDANADPQAVSRGAVIYKAHCMRCHGENVDGRGPAALPDHPGKDFHAFATRFAVTLHRGAPRSWFRKITEGFGEEVEYPEGRSTAMPPFGDKLTREQIWLAITYLQSLDRYATPTD